MEDRPRPMNWLDRFCIAMIGVAALLVGGLILAVFFGLAIIVGNTG